MIDEPLLPYLIEVVSQPEAEGTFLSGGWGYDSNNIIFE